MKASMSPFDKRDRAVLEQLDPGDVVTPEQVKKLFQRYTDIKRSRTLKRRVKDLTSQPVFERVDYRRWRFEGLEDSS